MNIFRGDAGTQQIVRLSASGYFAARAPFFPSISSAWTACRKVDIPPIFPYAR